MTPQEKAKELFDKFRKASRHKYLERTSQDANEQAKILAILCVDEIIGITDPAFKLLNAQPPDSLYWHQVKEEINKL